MLEKPPIADATITASLNDAYGLNIAEISFLPLGADMFSAVYRAVAADETPYFVKLRRGEFNEATLLVPVLLYEQGMPVIPPIPTRTGGLWATVDEYALMVFPFIEGINGYQTDLTDTQWGELGRTLKALHSTNLPPTLERRIPREDFSPYWRERVKDYQRQAENTAFDDPISNDLAALLREKQAEIGTLVSLATRYAEYVSTPQRPFVLCHADIHAGNVLITPDGQFYVVDWDTLIFAPKERDLMFPGGGLFGYWRAPQDEDDAFYEGYGSVGIDIDALAYYRCERVVQDIGAYCEQILESDSGDQDRAEGLQTLSSQFLPGCVAEIALNTENSIY